MNPQKKAEYPAWVTDRYGQNPPRWVLEFLRENSIPSADKPGLSIRRSYGMSM